MMPGPVFAFIGFFLAAPAAAQKAVARPALTPVAVSSNVRSDTSASFDQMEKSIEQEYAKLVQDAKTQKSDLEDKIKEIDRQIAALKEHAKKLDQVARKMDELLPKIMAGLGGDTGGRGRTPSPPKRDQFAAHLKAELAALGVGVSPDQLSKIMDALGKGGSGGMALAMQIVTQIADARAKQLDDQIASAAVARQAQKAQIAALEKQIAKLEADKQKAIAELRKQKEKALADAQKAQDSRLLRLPTPTPARKP